MKQSSCHFGAKVLRKTAAKFLSESTGVSLLRRQKRKCCWAASCEQQAGLYHRTGRRTSGFRVYSPCADFMYATRRPGLESFSLHQRSANSIGVRTGRPENQSGLSESRRTRRAFPSLPRSLPSRSETAALTCTLPAVRQARTHLLQNPCQQKSTYTEENNSFAARTFRVLMSSHDPGELYHHEGSVERARRHAAARPTTYTGRADQGREVCQRLHDSPPRPGSH